MPVITLLTDFGLRDGYPGVMKGVIWKVAPEVQISDISHSIKPQNIYQGSLALYRTYQFFPPGTIHVAVVDPGVGTHRRPIALKLGDYYFVGPDNGLFTMVLQEAERNHRLIQVIHLDQKKYWLPEVSRVFHGRDIFAPVGAHLANGVSLDMVGTLIDDPVRLEIPQPEIIQGGGWRGQVIEVDTFGNLSTNIEQHHLDQLGKVVVKITDQQIDGLVNTFGDRASGTLIAHIGTSNDLCISIVNGNASEALQVSIGEPVEVHPQVSTGHR